MGRPRTGSVSRHGDHWDIRITLPGGERSNAVCQPPEMTEEEARKKARKATAVAKMRGAAKRSQLEENAPPGESVSAYSERWCDARETRGLVSVENDRGRLSKWVLPKLDP